jgi:hypothetical protein
MATVTNGTAGSGQSFASDPLAVGGWQDGDESESKSDRYLAKRLAAAGADYKGVALTTFLLGAGVAVLVWLAVGIVLEHWIVPGGLSQSLRWAWLVTGLATLVAAIVRWVVPLMRYRVNLVYAARAIEREHPELHNDLVNTVLVKAHPEASPPMVVRSLERRTAKRLSDVPTEGVIDRMPALRLACVLAALVGTACLYELFAPKSFVVSAARLLAPWANWAAPSRVSIQPVELSWRMPGEQLRRSDDDGGAPERRRLVVESGAATLVRGRQLVVSADIRGLRRDEQPIVTVAPVAGGAADRAAASWQAPMDRGESVAGLRAPAESSRLKRFAAVLPDAARGLDEPVEIVISAGDARGEPVRIAVVDSPSLLVREVRYDYPPYTRRQPETVDWQGDIRAVEGTQVTIVAECNQPLDAAWIDFECDGDHDLPFNKKATDLARVTKSFPLEMNADRSGPAHALYRLVFRPRAASGSAREPEVVEPMEHRIEVIPDLAPEVSIEEPRESPTRVPPGAPVAIRVRALDPDFALARVGIETRLRGGPIQPDITLLAEEKTGVFKGSARIVPERLGAGPGSVLEYRAVAIDTRPNAPNIAHTGWQSLEIDASAPPRPPEEPAPRSAGDQEERSNDSGVDSAEAGEGQRDGESDESSPDQQTQQEKQQDQLETQQQERQQEDQKQQDQKQNGQQPKSQQGDKSGAAEGGQKGGKQKTPGQSQRGDKQGAGANQGQGADQGQGVGTQGQRQGGQQSESQKSQDGAADKAGDSKSGGQQQNGQKQNGQEKDGQEQRGQEQGGQERGGNKQDGKQQAGGQQKGKDQAGKSDAGKEQGGAQAGGKPKPKPAVASDGTNDGEAMERILDDRRQNMQFGEGAGKPGAGQQGQGKEVGDQQGGEQQGGEQQGGEQQGKGQPGAGQQGAGKQGEGHQPGTGQQGDGQQGSDQQGSDRQGSDRQGSDRQGPGQQQAAGEKNGDGGKSQNQQGGGEGEQQGGKEGGAQGGGERGSGEPGGDEQAAGKQPGNGNQSGDGKSGEQKPDERKGGEAAGKQPGGNEQAGDPQPGGQQSGGEQAGNEQAGSAGQSGKTAREGGQGPQQGEAPAPAQSGKPGSGSGAAGSGGWAGGDGPNEPGKPQPEGPTPSKQTEWGEEDLRNAKNAADLAIEHLRSAVEAGRSDVLDRLGWTREQARAFLERWEKMRRMAETEDPVQRGEFERAVRSLGLRPDGVKSSRDVPSDVRGGQAEGRRSRPPSEYREQFKAYTQGTAGE